MKAHRDKCGIVVLLSFMRLMEISVSVSMLHTTLKAFILGKVVIIKILTIAMITVNKVVYLFGAR